MTAILSSSRRSKPASLDPLMRLVADDMQAVNAVILNRMQSEVPLIPELAGHLISSGGKRMRPMLMLACSRLIGQPETVHYKLAAAIEFIHTATLLHDDVVDHSDLRRGKRTANNIWGNGPTVLVGDFLLSRAFEMMVESGSLRALDILANAAAVITQGEVDQLVSQYQVETDEPRYLSIIGAKTAVLFAASCRIAAVMAGCSDILEQNLANYGQYLGIAFQLVDDAIDYMSDSETMGKGVGDDFRDGKVTLPVILAYKRGDDKDRIFWREAIEGRRISNEDLMIAKDLLVKTDALTDTLKRAHEYGDKAMSSLKAFPDNAVKEALLETVEFTIARAY
ncbi:MAG: polyprenyl synthetase family protein [Zymomonas mobilis subsp. pomaceae]|uniref:Trans-hexaprenyltranstransferase n=1 Tax=Zymomonas mobilis subsp. pomaceae (strain ATCC 29192 / DSM 22645 / JCM 10191 / CCUG 17912 / NBRC 13757 / NCIMB 11200 / NRRL B-4491 / Barker I) TaxID=579138 RepID=F8ERY0_ZYMMT|nr:polyprenyl synthetase family protein [Zymomonas mobilis]AEI37555.1 Trans-hexaprenyltranstransferase [Zymomonas mobilis subsp. pomaceae ATCC 29192]MDX5948923.1 polyprenyl synthetase family protein [Zymomonas mobilis subsp. pomaceae]GEB88728.1 octaprenyl-diphosphate synthase [Zymomonas mobilis subsp. pomaceae]